MNLNKKRIWVIGFILSVMMIWLEFNAIVEYISHRDYRTCTSEDLTEAYVTVEFLEGENCNLEEEWQNLTKDFRYYRSGEIHRAVLSDGRKVLVISTPYLGDFQINTPIRGIFDEIPSEVSYLLSEYQIEPYIFFCFEKFLLRRNYHLIILLVGVMGAFICICGFLSNIFPDLFPALFKKDEKKERSARDSNFELLRILCMIMIIMQHFAFWGEFDIEGEITGNTIVLQSIVNAGKIGVNCFVMITGYYGAVSTFRASKITKLIAQVWFYTWGISAILFTTGIGIRSVENVQKTIFPICSGTFWFVTIYLIMYILSPYLNEMIQNIEQQKFKTLLIFLFIIWSVFPSFVKPGWEYTNTGWFIFMYLLGAYLRKYPTVWCGCTKKASLVFVSMYVVLMCLTYVWDKRVGMVVYHQALAQKHTIPIVICSVALFVAFKNINIGHRKVINSIAASTFGVYLIHENPVLNDLLWTDWLKVNTYFERAGFIWHALGMVLFVYVSCTMIDMARKKGIDICKIFWHMIVDLYKKSTPK